MAETYNALVMSGGGARGAFEVGAVDYLINDHDVDFQVITGVSTGSLNAGMLAQAADFGELQAQINKIKAIYKGIENEEQIFKKRGVAAIAKKFPFLNLDALLGDYDDLLGGIFNNSIYDFTPLKEMIEDLIKPARLSASKRHLRVGAVSLNSSEYESVDGKNEKITDYILASSMIPLFGSPVKIGNEYYVDGGIRNVTPLKDAFEVLRSFSNRDNVHNVYVVLASPLQEPHSEENFKKANIVDILRRSTDILVSEVYINDLEACEEINKLLQDPVLRDHELLKDRLPANLHVIAPDEVYIGSLEFDEKKIDRALQAGYDKAKEVLS